VLADMALRGVGGKRKGHWDVCKMPVTRREWGVRGEVRLLIISLLRAFARAGLLGRRA
jgi:hypothetical protein